MEAELGRGKRALGQLMIEAYLKAKLEVWGGDGYDGGMGGEQEGAAQTDQRRGERPRAKREYWARSSSRRDAAAGITKTSRVTSHTT